MLKKIPVLTTDGSEDYIPEDPYDYAVREIRGLYEIFRYKTNGFFPKELEGKFTHIHEAKHAILKYHNRREYEKNFKPSGRPRVKYRWVIKGHKSGTKLGPYGPRKKKDNIDGTSETSSTSQ